MVKFNECGNGREFEHAFTAFDRRVAGVFESACRAAFSAVKDAVLEDCKALRAAVEDAALHDERYADNKELLKAFLEFEDILRFDDSSVQKILRAVDQVDLACALKISSDELKTKVFGNMSRTAGEMLKEDMEAVRPVLKSTVQEKQRKILDVVEEMLACHELYWPDECVQ